MMNNTNYLKLLAFLATTFLLFGCSEDGALSAQDSATGSGSDSDELLRLGNGSGAGFVEGTLEIKTPDVTANGSTIVSAYIVDDSGNLSTASSTVSFTSHCSIQALASFSSASVTTTTGIATTSFIDEGCQTNDTIIATADWDPSITASGDITLASSDPTSADTVQIGSGSGLNFVPGVIVVSPANISTDGSAFITVNLVDANGTLLFSSNSVTFTSTCEQEQPSKASFTNPIVTTSTGTASTTYNAGGCVGNDPITATISIGNIQKSASGSVTVAAASAGSIQFSSVDNTLIALQGTGSTAGLPENTTVTFTVLDGSSAPVANENVTFSLNNTVGGITLSSYTATSNASGEVTTSVQSGTVATSVRIIATVDSNTSLATTSDSIAVATGPPDQDSMSLSAETLNPRAWNVDGQIVKITARLADRFNNRIQDGTAVLFTTELGAIEASCTTIDGACSVEWESQNPKNDAGRNTILATVEGEESFVDLNANGVFDGADTFTDLAEAYLDTNENAQFDSGEPYVDFNSDGSWTPADGKYNGAGCAHATDCATKNSMTVRASLVLVMAEDVPEILAMGTNGFTDNLCDSFASCYALRYSGNASIHTDIVSSLSVTIGGIENGQVLPAGSTVEFLTSNGQITSGRASSIGNTSSIYPSTFFLTIVEDGNEDGLDGSLTVKVKVDGTGITEELFLTTIIDDGAATATGELQLGTGSGVGFSSGEMDLTSTNLSAGGSTFISVNAVYTNGDLVTGTPVTVNFASDCVALDKAFFDNASVITSTGTATATYTTNTCEGIDVISATISGTAALATATVDIQAAAAGSVQSGEASASIIALQGTGMTTGIPESADVIFTVLNDQGGAITGETVNFSLDSYVGGVSLASTTANTNTDGQVTATILSGTVATSVRVTATLASNPALSTTSSAIVIATGPPDQDSFSLSASELNPNAWNYDGIEVTITARLADRFNNRIQDGTAVSFITELGAIEPSCVTEDGACSVIWTSQSPRGTSGLGSNAGRTTIIATVEGEESFIDVDGNGVFSNGDSFVDLAEAYRDDNEDGEYDSGETFIDFNVNGVRDDISNTYNGSGCTHPTLCDSFTNSVTVRDSITIVMAEDYPTVVAIGINGYDTSGVTAAQCDTDKPLGTKVAACVCVEGCDGVANGGLGSTFPLSLDLSTTVNSINFTIAGYSNNQVLPVGTEIVFETSNGEIVGGETYVETNTSISPVITTADPGNPDIITYTNVTQYTVYMTPDTTSTFDGYLSFEITIPPSDSVFGGEDVVYGPGSIAAPIAIQD